MKMIVAVAVLLAPGAAVAQGYAGTAAFSNPQPSMNMPNYSTDASLLAGRDPFPAPESPAVRKEKLARAIALRDEALVMEARDGGRLSGESQAYLRRKARDILAYR